MEALQAALADYVVTQRVDSEDPTLTAAAAATWAAEAAVVVAAAAAAFLVSRRQPFRKFELSTEQREPQDNTTLTVNLAKELRCVR